MRTNPRRSLFSLLFMAALLLVQFPAAYAAEQFLEFEIDGQMRRVLLYVPDAPSPEPRTLVVVFHGRGDDDRAFASAVRLHKDWPDAIVAYPRGETRDQTQTRVWQYRVGDQGGRDLALTDRLLEELARRYGTRPERTHVAGFSNGGHFVLLLLAERPEAFASFTVIGSVLPGFNSDSPPKPVLYLFGRGEDRKHKDDWAGTVEALARHNRTTGPLAKFMGCCHLQSPAPGGAPFVFGQYGAGHIWPSQGNEWLMTFAQRATASGAHEASPNVEGLQESLVAYSASDFAASGSRPQGFRKVGVRYRENDEGERVHMLCGQARMAAAAEAEWVDFATVKTDPYEQWLGGAATDMCARAVPVSGEGDDLSASLQSKLDLSPP